MHCPALETLHGVLQREIAELGGKAVTTISGPDGYIYDADGITGEKVDYMLEMRASGRDKVQDYADKFGVPFYPGEKPWNVKVDVVMPCAIRKRNWYERSRTNCSKRHSILY